MEPRDRNRKTPLDLAAKHGHEEIIKFLEGEKRRRNTFLPVFLDIWYVRSPHAHIVSTRLKCVWTSPSPCVLTPPPRTLVFGQSGKTKGPLLFFLASVLLWAYPMYFLRVSKSKLEVWPLVMSLLRCPQCVPVTWEILPQTHYTFLFMNLVMWVSLLVANQRDPGFLAKNTEEYHRYVVRNAHLIGRWYRVF